MVFYISRFKEQKIESHKFDLEVVTPMFLSGAYNDQAELRAPSFKGMLRFWWRAINANLPIGTLKEQEAKIFGDVGDNFGKSKIQIKINNAINYDGKSRANPVPHKNVRFNFPCFNSGERFSLEIVGPKNVFDLFKMISILGGIGKRSRRGFGSFIINKIDGVSFKPVSSIQEIFDLIKLASDGGYKIENNVIIKTENLSNDYGYIKRIEIGTILYRDYKTLLEIIGKSSHDNNSDFTGYAKGKERFSSPIYVSIIKVENGYQSVITTLNTAFKHPQGHGVDKSETFKKDILSGGAK